MSRLTDANLRQLLRHYPAPPSTDIAVPPDLLERIQAEIPEQLELPPADPFSKPPPGQRRWPRLRLLAASLIGVIGAGWLYLQVGQPMTRDGGFERAADLGAAQTMAPPAPTTSPSKTTPKELPPTDPPTVAAEQTHVRRADSAPPAVPATQAAATAALSAPAAIAPAELNEAALAQRRLSKQAPSVSTAKPRLQEPQRAAAEIATDLARSSPLAKTPPPSIDQATHRVATTAAPLNELQDIEVQAARRRSTATIHHSRQLEEQLAQVRLAPSPSSGSQPLFDPDDSPLSNFGLEVGNTSFAVLRSSLEAGQMPPRETVRIEQLLNHFDYGDTAPTTADFALRVEGAPSIFAGGAPKYLLRVTITSRRAGIVDQGPSPDRRKIATAAQAWIEFDPRSVSSYRLLGYRDPGTANPASRANSVEPRLSAYSATGGAVGNGQQLTAMWQVELHRPLQPNDLIATAKLRWTAVGGGEARTLEQPIGSEDFALNWTAASPAMRLCSLVAEYGLLLGESPAASPPDADRLATVATSLARQTGDPQAAELARLIRLAQDLWSKSP